MKAAGLAKCLKPCLVDDDDVVLTVGQNLENVYILEGYVFRLELSGVDHAAEVSGEA